MNHPAPLPHPINRLLDILLGTLIGGLSVFTTMLLRKYNESRVEDETDRLENWLADQAYAQWQADPDSARPYAAFRAELIEEGLLDGDPEAIHR